MAKKEEAAEEVNKKELTLEAGACKLVIGKDDMGRPTITPVCPKDDHGIPKVSDEVKALSDILHSPEVVLRPPKVLEEKS